MGAIIDGKYRVDGLLGVGGMGYVLAATHAHLRERVALKMLLPERAANGDTVRRFLREGRAAIRIRSEHIARVLDVGTADGTPYMVMEYLEGADLAALLEREGRLPWPRAIDYVLQACEALAEAHAAQTVHRDLKPANLFVTRRPDGSECVKVLDFGISKMADVEDTLLTQTASTMGTPLYMSPEQLKSAKNVDARADVWSLGVILFELIAGDLPFSADSMAMLSVLVLTTDAPDLRTRVPDAPEGLARAIATCLSREVDKRFASVADMARAVAPWGTDAARQSAVRIANVLGNVMGSTGSVAVASPSSVNAFAATVDSGRGALALATTTEGASVGVGSSAHIPPTRGAGRSARWFGAFGILGFIGLVAIAATGWRAASHRRHSAPTSSPAADLAAGTQASTTATASQAPPAPPTSVRSEPRADEATDAGARLAQTTSGTPANAARPRAGTTTAPSPPDARRASGAARAAAPQPAATASTTASAPTRSKDDFVKGRFGE